MFAIPATRESRPVAVLLGGSGYARPSLRMPTVPALLKPPPPSPDGLAALPSTVP
jgi:hypothetical protein